MNVYQAISAVQKDLSAQGISKDRKNTQGSGYAFRGIDDVYNALSPFLAKHGLCILPRVLNRESVERQSKAGGALFYITVEVEFDLVAADGSKHTIKTFGEAMDSGDKATNKAMSAAYKYACMQSFCIPTEGDNDADSTTHEIRQEEKWTPEQKSLQAVLFTELGKCLDDVTLDSFLEQYGKEIESLPKEMSGILNDGIENRRQAIKNNVALLAPESHGFAG